MGIQSKEQVSFHLIYDKSILNCVKDLELLKYTLITTRACGPFWRQLIFDCWVTDDPGNG